MATAAIGAMREEDWKSLTRSIERGRCILMLGPSTFTADFDGEHLPVAVGMARFVKERLADLHGAEFAQLDPADPWSVARAARDTEDLTTLGMWIEDFYERYDTTSQPLRKLASLPFPLIVNTSPGFSAERAFREHKARTVVDFYDRNGRARAELPDASVDAPVVYQLFGSLSEPASLVLTDSDRLDFLVSVIAENPPLPRKLTSALCDPHESFLFLGFDLGQWQLRMLMYVVLRNVQRDSKSFALELDAAALDAEAVRYYLRGHKVHFVDEDLPRLVDELVARVVPAPAVASPTPLAETVEPGAPAVFLCHAHEDATFAAHLADGLRRNNIEVWLDKHSLRGGDRWDAEIKRVLTKEVSYVVVLQSASLMAKDRNHYVNKEISIAIDHQPRYRPPRIFLIPAVIDSQASRLEMLDEWQSVDLTAGIDELVRAIKRDVDIDAREVG